LTRVIAWGPTSTNNGVLPSHSNANDQGATEQQLIESHHGGLVEATNVSGDEAPRASQERFRRCFELSPIGTAITSPSKGCLEVNDALCRILGYARHELLRKTWDELTHPDDLCADLGQFDRVVAGEIDGYTLDKRWLRGDGKIVSTIMSARAVRCPDGSVDYFIGLVQDITERMERFGTNTDVEDRHQTEETLRKLQEELALGARATTLGEVVASIAHELNQPLAAIAINAGACTRWLAAQPPNLPEVNKVVECIGRDAHRAAEVIAQIRAFLRREPVQHTPININEVIADVIGMMREEMRKQNVSVQVEPLADPPAVEANRTQLQQVILNLVLNAIESLSQVTDRPRRLSVKTVRDGDDTVRVEVGDTGVGVALDQMNWIFDAFHTTKPQGLGMGLAIIRTIVEAHGGRVWVMANDGPGVTFCFTLPITGMAIVA
jgi:PAS domain S-box-containing protein